MDVQHGIMLLYVITTW